MWCRELKRAKKITEVAEQNCRRPQYQIKDNINNMKKKKHLAKLSNKHSKIAKAVLGHVQGLENLRFEDDW